MFPPVAARAPSVGGLLASDAPIPLLPGGPLRTTTTLQSPKSQFVLLFDAVGPFA